MPETARACPNCHTTLPLGASFCYVCGTATPPSIDRATGEFVSPSGPSMSLDEMARRLRRVLGASYDLGDTIGSGGFAIVFKARDVRLKREVAIKVARPEFSLDAQMLQRFRREAEAIAALRHTHILPIFDVGEGEGLAYIVMPFVHGESLKARLEREPRLPVPLARRILLQAADALGTAHEVGLVHRDVKPDNIMLERRGDRVLLMDFGIAKAVDAGIDGTSGPLTSTGLVIGTPHFMSPEQAMGERALDHRTDQYALAVVAYRMLAGVLPFDGPTIRAVLTKQLIGECEPLSRVRPEVPEALSAAIARAMAKEPNDRFASMDDFVAAIRADPDYVSEMLATHASGAFPPLATRETPRDGAPVTAEDAAGITGAAGAVERRAAPPALTSEAGVGTAPVRASDVPDPPAQTPAGAPVSARGGSRRGVLVGALALVAAGAAATVWLRGGTDRTRAALSADSAATLATASGDSGAADDGTADSSKGTMAAADSARGPALSAADSARLATDTAYQRQRRDSLMLAQVKLTAGTPAADSFLTGARLSRRRSCEARWAARAVKDAELACRAEALLAPTRVGPVRVLGLFAEERGQHAAAARWFEQVAERDPESAYRLSRLLDEGRGVAVDHQRAAAMLRRSADGGLPVAQFAMGRRLRDGLHGMERNEGAAADWFNKAALAGDVEAMSALGTLFKDGRGVAKNLGEAAAWWQKAAAKGDTAAMYQLGLAHYGGKGVPKSDSMGIALHLPLARAGHAGAQYELRKRKVPY